MTAAEMWFGIVFAVLVEIVPLQVRSTAVGVFLFVMNNIGGNLPIVVEPVSKAIGYREAIMIFYAGFYGISQILKKYMKRFIFEIIIQPNFIFRLYYVLVNYIFDGWTETSSESGNKRSQDGKWPR